MSEKKENNNLPVVGQYRKVELDLWDAWHLFTIEDSQFIGLDLQGREGSKEYKACLSRAWVFAHQFWLKVKNSFSDTWDKMDAREMLLIKSEFVSDGELEKYLEKHIPLTSSYKSLMYLIERGVIGKKKVIERYVPTQQDLFLVGEFMSLFIDVSGIGNIEHRFVEEEQGSAF